MTTIIAFIIVLGVLVVVHELGHFVTAKMAGIAVPRFSIGLGPKVWGITIGGTEYVISALPLGGYVKMAGMGEEEAMERLEGGSVEGASKVPEEERFDSKPLHTRAVVISAGVVMNFLFAVVAFGLIAFWQGVYVPVVGEVRDGSPAERAGLRAGDRIVAVDGRELDRWTEFVGYVAARPGEQLSLRVDRDGEIMTLSAEADRVVRRDTISGDSAVIGQIGIWVDTIAGRESLGAGTALLSGFNESVEVTVLIVEYIGQLITGQESARNLGGPILIGQLSGQAARAGLPTLIQFMALLSVHLAVLNLLPIPILDGGHLLFLTIEAVRGRALSLEARARLSQIGFILILALMVWVITADVLRITGG